MRIFKNISIIDSVDSFCSTFGNELIYEKGNITNLILPCFNIGFYENEINADSVTKAVDICYFLFENISKCKIKLNTYDNIFPKENGLIELNGKGFNYNFDFTIDDFGKITFEVSGICFRLNSFSYGSYAIKAKELTVILLDETNFLSDYTSNDKYKTDASIQAFLLNKDMKYIDLIKRHTVLF